MITKEKVIVIDLDGTLCSNKESHQNYLELQPHEEVILKLREYRKKGFYIIIYSSRNMRTYEGNIGLINANTLKDKTKAEETCKKLIGLFPESDYAPQAKMLLEELN